MKWFVVLLTVLLAGFWLSLHVVPLPFWLGAALFPEKYAAWDFTAGRQVDIIDWPAEEFDSLWAAPRRHVAITTPGRETKVFRGLVGYAFVERQEKLVRSVDVTVYYYTFAEALAVARQWEAEYGVVGDEQSLDQLEFAANAGATPVAWRGRGGGVELCLAGHSAGTSCYFGVTFYLDGTSGAPDPSQLSRTGPPTAVSTSN